MPERIIDRLAQDTLRGLNTYSNCRFVLASMRYVVPPRTCRLATMRKIRGQECVESRITPVP